MHPSTHERFIITASSGRAAWESYLEDLERWSAHDTGETAPDYSRFSELFWLIRDYLEVVQRILVEWAVTDHQDFPRRHLEEIELLKKLRAENEPFLEGVRLSIEAELLRRNDKI